MHFGRKRARRKPARAALALASLGLLAGCGSIDQTLNSADRTLSAVNTSTVRSVAAIGGSRDPNEALRQALKSRSAMYERNPQALISDLRTAKHDYDKLTSLLSGNVDKKWGHKEVKLPSRTQYIKYTQNYKSRAIVEFDTGEITVETLDDKDPKASLKNAVTTTLLTPDDPRAVDLFTDKSVSLTSDKKPYLQGLVVDQRNQPIATPAQAETFADNVIGSRSGTREV